MKRLQRTLSKGFGDVVAKCFGFSDQSRGKHKNSDVNGTRARNFLFNSLVPSDK